MRRSTLAIVTAFTVMLAACNGNSSNSSTTSTTTSTTNTNGANFTISGSTALLPLVKEAAQEYQAAHADVKISVSGGGSKVGLTQVAAKAVDIGDSDIVPSADQAGLVDHRVAVATFAVITNPAVGIKNLTAAQIRDIFTGKTANWNQVGGPDQKITIVNRPKSSGTRAVFTQTVMANTATTENALTQDSSGTVVTMVAQTPGAVSYVSTGYLKNKAVSVVNIDGIAPTGANLTNGKYKFWSYEHMYTNGPPSKQSADFIAFITKNTKLLTQLSFAPITIVKPK